MFMSRLNIKSEVFDPNFRVNQQTLEQFFDPSKSNIKGAFYSTNKLIEKYWRKNPDVLRQAQTIMKKEEEDRKLEKIHPGRR